MTHKKVAFGILLGLAVLLVGYWHFFRSSPALSDSNPCLEMMMSSLRTAESHSFITVPDFSYDSVAHIRCAAVPGLLAFEIAGTDKAGSAFHIFETTGGKAASGADSVLDYCYLRGESLASQIRITGREGARSDSACAYDASLIPEPAYVYEYGG